MRDFRADFILLVTDRHRLEPVSKDPEAHLSPSEAALEQNKEAKGSAEQPSFCGSDGPEVVREIRAEEAVRTREASCEQVALDQPFDG